MALEMRTHGQTYEAVIKIDNQDVANLNANINPSNVFIGFNSYSKEILTVKKADFEADIADFVNMVFDAAIADLDVASASEEE